MIESTTNAAANEFEDRKIRAALRLRIFPPRPTPNDGTKTRPQPRSRQSMTPYAANARD